MPFNLFPGLLVPKPTTTEQVADWFADAIDAVSWPWGWDDNAPHSRYNTHLWTIPIEFAHSMLLFLALLCVSRMRTGRIRRATLAEIAIGALCVYSHWAAFEFLIGAVLADQHLSLEASERERMEDGNTEKPKQKYHMVFRAMMMLLYVLVLAAAGYIISWPVELTPSYSWLQDHVPSSFEPTTSKARGQSFWFALAAVGIVWACGRVALLKRVLETPPAQYAGRISFAYYLLQHSLLTIFEHPILGVAGTAATEERAEGRGRGLRGLTGQSTSMQRNVCWVLGLVVLGGMAIWVADLFWRFIDMPFVRAAKRLEKWVFVAEEEEGGFVREQIREV